eukprot:1250148-Alexandrium_andersonii.AAC.1
MAAGLLEDGLSTVAKEHKFGAVPEAVFRSLFASIDARIRDRLAHWCQCGATAVAALVTQLADQRFR